MAETRLAAAALDTMTDDGQATGASGHRMRGTPTMRIRRDNLFWGLVFLGLGAIPLLVRAGTIEPAIFVDVERWWPVALIAIGVLLVLGRSRAALLGVAIAGLTIGILGGGMLATGSGFLGGLADCGALGGDRRTRAGRRRARHLHR